VVHTGNPSTQETEAKGSEFEARWAIQWGQDQPGLICHKKKIMLAYVFSVAECVVCKTLQSHFILLIKKIYRQDFLPKAEEEPHFCCLLATSEGLGGKITNGQKESLYSGSGTLVHPGSSCPLSSPSCHCKHQMPQRDRQASTSGNNVLSGFPLGYLPYHSPPAK
jgi:hypothetical protein